MKQVLLVATVGGFVPQFEMNDVKVLKKLGCKIHYAANFDNNMYMYDENIFKEYDITIHNICMQKSPFKIIKNYKAYRNLKNVVEQENIDLIHCHTPVGGLLARIAGTNSKRKPKVIYTTHGFHFYKGASIWNWCTYYLVERFMARKTDAIVTINEEDYINAKKFRLRNNGKVYKIPGVGLDVDRFQIKEYKKKDDIFNIVTIGEINKNKNHKVVIKAMKKLARNDIYYTIYGRGDYESYIQKLIKKLDMEKYIQLKGYTTKPEEVLLKADCFVFPSKREGLGMVGLEAMACGLPVIAYDNRGTREYMRDGYNGVVCFLNKPYEYMEAIETLAKSEELISYMSSNARNTAERYRIEQTEEIMRLVYGRLVSEL